MNKTELLAQYKEREDQLENLRKWAFQGAEIGEDMHGEIVKPSLLKASLVAITGAFSVGSAVIGLGPAFPVEAALVSAISAGTALFLYQVFDLIKRKLKTGPKTVRDVPHTVESIAALQYKALMGLIEVQSITALLEVQTRIEDLES